ncbi:MAG: DUF6805 domain-containing protein, partial [Leeuwenhoekiella sp.]
IPSEVNWDEKKASVRQETNFPEEAATELIWESKKKTKATLMLRYPQWVKARALKLYVNGTLQEIDATPGSYIPLERKWKNGDRIKLELPMHLSLEEIPDESGYVSVKYGPIVLAAVTGEDNQDGLFADDSRGGHIADGPFLPLNEAPMFVSEEGAPILDQIKPVSGKVLEFSAVDLFYPDNYKDLILQPFYKIHEKRYSIYFKVESPQSLAKMQQELKEKQEAEVSLRAITLDYVAPGEQQPESDHGVQSENSNSGIHQNRHWRDATGYFSYDLKNKEAKAKTLRVTYYGEDSGRKFRILVNGKIVAEPQLMGEKGDTFFEVDYSLPQEVVANNEILTVRFEALPGSVAGGVYGVRLLSIAATKN